MLYSCLFFKVQKYYKCGGMFNTIMDIISVEPFSPLQSMDGIFFAFVDIGNSNSAQYYCGKTFLSGVEVSMSKESPFQELQVEGI